jgi:raffinose/stachyose/melibiose transport system substrate-binding protein
MTTTPQPSRRRFLQGAGATAFGLLLPGTVLGACGSDSGNSGAQTVEFWMDIQGGPNQAYFDDKVIAAFEKARPGIDIDVTYHTGGDLRKLIQTALQARSGPDIVRGASASQTLAWSQAGVLTDLMPYAEKWGWGDTLSGWALEAFTVDDKLWALPMRVDSLLLYTNATLFDEKGWTPPTNLGELEALATEAHGQGIVPLGASITDWKAASEWHMSAVWNHYAGPDAVYQALTGEVRWTEPVFVEAVQLIKGWFDKGWFGGGIDRYFSVPAQEVGANFGQSKVAMVPQGVWWMSSVGNFFGEAGGNQNEWDWAPWPSLSPDVTYPLYDLGIGGSLGINANSDKRDAAAEYLNWYYGDRTAALQRMADVPATYNIPIRFEADEVPDAIDERSRRVLDELNTAVATGNYGYVTWTWWPPKANAFVYEGFEKVLTGDLSPAEYCAQMDELFQQERADGHVPKTISRP